MKANATLYIGVKSARLYSISIAGEKRLLYTSRSNEKGTLYLGVKMKRLLYIYEF